MQQMPRGNGALKESAPTKVRMPVPKEVIEVWALKESAPTKVRMRVPKEVIEVWALMESAPTIGYRLVDEL